MGINTREYFIDASENKLYENVRQCQGLIYLKTQALSGKICYVWDVHQIRDNWGVEWQQNNCQIKNKLKWRRKRQERSMHKMKVNIGITDLVLFQRL